MKPRKLRRMQVLADMATRHGWRRMAELGVFKGDTAEYLLKNCPGLTLLMVDTWTPGDPSLDTPEAQKKRPGDKGFRSYIQHPLAAYRANVERMAMRYAGRAVVMPMTTLEAAAQIEDGSLCAAFLDAGHDAASVEADIRAYAPKIRPGGWLTGHDADMESVRGVIDRLLPGWRGYDDSVWGIPGDEVRL